MAGETHIVKYIMRNGKRYKISAGSKYSDDFRGDGVDGVLTVPENCTCYLTAKLYSFTNVNICPNATVCFCGEGVPVIKANGSFTNCGCIDLRRAGTIACNCTYTMPFNLGSVTTHCGTIPLVTSNWNRGGCGSVGTGSGGDCWGRSWDGGGYGQDGGGHCCVIDYCGRTWIRDNSGGKSCCGNGGGGASMFKYLTCGSYCCLGFIGGTKGCDATETGGGRGGDGGYDTFKYFCTRGASGGGGGGYGHTGNGGDGGTGGYNLCRGGASDGGEGGGSCLYNGGNGGTGGSAGGISGGDGGKGGDSYCGNGGTGGCGGIGSIPSTYSHCGVGTGGNGGNSIYGNGGNGGWGDSGGNGGCSCYGNGGNGGAGYDENSYNNDGANGGNGGLSARGNGGNGGKGGNGPYTATSCCGWGGNGGCGGDSGYGTGGNGGAGGNGYNCKNSSYCKMNSNGGRGGDATGGMYSLIVLAKCNFNSNCIYGKGGSGGNGGAGGLWCGYSGTLGDAANGGRGGNAMGGGTVCVFYGNTFCSTSSCLDNGTPGTGGAAGTNGCAGANGTLRWSGAGLFCRKISGIVP